MIDESLIAGCVRKEPKAQYELYRALYPLMMSICTRYQRDRQEAAATMNQGFLKILDNLGSRRPDVPFDPWVRRVMINTVIDAHRRDKQERAMVTSDVEAHEVDGSEINGFLEQMEAEAFAEMLLRVPVMSRTVFNLFAIDGFSHAEVAEMLSISEGTAKWHVHHARTVLRNAIARSAMARTAKTVSR
jgi:RNA polymerase sigma factor (sigma-70 family)